jgi:hypothetical protein
VGECSGNTGEETCTAGSWGNDTCNPLAGAAAEVCDDALDNDCDGKTDLLDTEDCWEEGPQGPAGAIDVYDANNQYLGILLDMHESFAKIYIPSMGKFIRISISSTDAGTISNQGTSTDTGLYYESTDCSGQPYQVCHGGAETSPCVYYIIPTYDIASSALPKTARYFITDDSTIIDERSFSSNYRLGECSQSSMETFSNLAAIEVTLPFNTPVAVPLRFE